MVAALDEVGAISKREPYIHSVGHSHRSGEPIEPLISLQWFCRMDELAAPAIEAVESDRVRIVPADPVEAGAAGLDAPTCGRGASRASSGGATGCPVWYCDACEETYVAETAA